MQKIIQVPVTQGNYARLQAIAAIMKVTPESLLNSSIMRIMQGADEVPYLYEYANLLFTPLARVPKGFKAMRAKLGAITFDGWDTEPLKQ